MATRHYGCWMVLSALLLAMSVSMLARAEDKKEDKKDDATGTWKWTFTGQNGQTRDVTLKLKQDGEKLTGTISGRNNTETEIKDGAIKDGDISFKVVRKRNDQEITTKYEAKLSGDTIKGKSTTDINGQETSRDFEAKRAKE